MSENKNENKKEILNSINKCLSGISMADIKSSKSSEEETKEKLAAKQVKDFDPNNSYTAKVTDEGVCEFNKLNVLPSNNDEPSAEVVDSDESIDSDTSDESSQSIICPECGESDLALVSSINNEVVLWCAACNTLIPYRRKRDEDSSNVEVNGLIKPVMEANNLNGPLSAIQFLVAHYNRTKHYYKGPGLMTIDDANRYLYIKEYPYNPRGYDKDMTRVLITYAKDFSDGEFSVDSVEFNCSNMEDLRMKWHDFIVQNGIYPDSIESFSIDVSFNYRQYVDGIISTIYNTSRSVFIDDKLFDTVINTAIYEDEVEYVKDILLTSKLFAPFRESIVFPHIEKVKNPNSGKMVPCVLRYLVEKGDDEE